MNFHFTATEIAIVGVTSGPVSLVLGVYNALKNKIKLVVERADLSFENRPKDYMGKSIKQLRDYSLRIKVDFEMSNRRTGSGSFERPILEIMVNNEQMIIPSYNNKDKSFQIVLYGRVDNMLGYELNAMDIKTLVDNIDVAKYFLRYKDHIGKVRCYPIINVKT